MESVNNPYAAGGGGWNFETLVAVQYAATILSGTTCDLGGRVERVSRQTTTPGFDDIGLVFEPKPGLPRRIDVQCRSRQPFTGGDAKFQSLLADAIVLVRGEDFSSGKRALAVVVGVSSPAHREMADLCDLARTVGDFPLFIEAINRRKGAMVRRWKQVLTASVEASTTDAFAALRVLHIRMADLESATAPGRLQLLKDLGRLWTPPNEGRASSLLEALYIRMAELGREAGTLDAQGLRLSLGDSAPPLGYFATRHESLVRLLHANEDEVRHSLSALGVDASGLEDLARDILNREPGIPSKGPTTLVVGPIGIGKSTELRRHYRKALRAAIEDVSSPIPVFLRAQQFRLGEMEQVAIREAEYIGDPIGLGIHLFVDALDEAGYELEDVLPEFRALIARMPGSTVIATSRFSNNENLVETTSALPLSDEEANRLIRRLRSDRVAHVFGRDEKLDLLRRPLFTIEYALNGANGSQRHSEAQLINGIGRRVSKNLTKDTFNALVDLAVKSVDYNGHAVPDTELFIAPPVLGELLRSRLVTNDSGGLRIQLAVLTEWFGSFAIFNDSSLLARTTETTEIAWRWRYVHAQALLQADSDRADALMTQLTLRSPATAAWVINEASDPHTTLKRRDTVGVSVGKVKNRLTQADAALFGVLCIIEPVDHLSNTAVESHVDIQEGTISIASRYVTDPPLVEQGILGAGALWSQFRRVRIGQYEPTGKWPWVWCLEDAQRSVDKWLARGAGLQDIEAAQAELAFDYALTMLNKNHLARPDQIGVLELEKVIEDYRSHAPQGDVRIAHGGRTWYLTDGERFVTGLKARGQSIVWNPWPPRDRVGRWNWLFWSEESRKLRLEATSREALNIYQELVDAALPSLAGLLSTYLLLPGKIVGSFTAADPDHGFGGVPQIYWHIEPQPPGASNSSVWTLEDDIDYGDAAAWAEDKKKVLAARGNIASVISHMRYGGFNGLYSSRPASSLALRLLSDDLKRLKWSVDSHHNDMHVPLAPEIFPKLLGS